MSIGAGVIEFDGVIPAGARTCADLPRKSGSVQHTWLDDDIEEYQIEDANLRANRSHPSLNPAQHLDALGQLVSLKERASRGQLPVGPDNTFPARNITSWAYLIELRPKLSKRSKTPRAFRLYYAEPVTPAGTLLPLVLSTKPNGPDHQGEQQHSITDAMARSRTWTLMQRMKEGH